MSLNILPSFLTIEIGGVPTLVFEAMNLREAHELCREQRLKTDLMGAISMPVRRGTATPNFELGSPCSTRPQNLRRRNAAAGLLTA
jgi:hypothetical protein